MLAGGSKESRHKPTCLNISNGKLLCLSFTEKVSLLYCTSWVFQRYEYMSNWIMYRLYVKLNYAQIICQIELCTDYMSNWIIYRLYVKLNYVQIIFTNWIMYRLYVKLNYVQIICQIELRTDYMSNWIMYRLYDKLNYVQIICQIELCTERLT